MCRAVTCKTCGKTTWAGCGQHVDAVMASVPRADRCTCSADSTSKPDTAGGSDAKGGKGLFAELFGRRG